jgi:hypothetical protein
MSKEQREHSLNKIRNDDAVSVILISFKAGSTGMLFAILTFLHY